MNDDAFNKQKVHVNEDTFNKDNPWLVKLLSVTPKFKSFTTSQISEFVSVGKFRECKEGEIIIQKGDYDCWVYLLLTGSVEVEIDGKIIEKQKRIGDLIGEMAVIDGSPRSATIRAISDVNLLGFDASFIDQKLKTDDVSFCYVVYRLFSEELAVRLRETTKENVKLRKMLSRFGDL